MPLLCYYTKCLHSENCTLKTITIELDVYYRVFVDEVPSGYSIFVSNIDMCPLAAVCGNNPLLCCPAATIILSTIVDYAVTKRCVDIL